MQTRDEMVAFKQLVDYVKEHHLTPPSPQNVSYNLSKTYKNYDAHDQYHKVILDVLEKRGIDRLVGSKSIILKKKIKPMRILNFLSSFQKQGFFVEAGALDGEYLSHSLDLEMKLGWKGLLVEASPSLIPQLKGKQRKSWIADVCLAASDWVYVDFLTKAVQKDAWMRGNGRINPATPGLNASEKRFTHSLHKSEGQIECFKLATLLKAINVDKVDLLILDIEGHEFKVLETHPFKEIPITIITVETWVMPEKFEVLSSFLFNQGYKLEYRSTTDAIFALK
ncbi:unnamed protein product [Orchesella dallaii]|uniref:Methyltransferase FkbM domain-containing protein n=1 Tax=Orchesella dallaii TaxID=48710 RepID=A0ABP1QCB1_9HEXA